LARGIYKATHTRFASRVALRYLNSRQMAPLATHADSTSKTKNFVQCSMTGFLGLSGIFPRQTDRQTDIKTMDACTLQQPRHLMSSSIFFFFVLSFLLRMKLKEAESIDVAVSTRHVPHVHYPIGPYYYWSQECVLLDTTSCLFIKSWIRPRLYDFLCSRKSRRLRCVYSTQSSTSPRTDNRVAQQA